MLTQDYNKAFEAHHDRFEQWLSDFRNKRMPNYRDPFRVETNPLDGRKRYYHNKIQAMFEIWMGSMEAIDERRAAIKNRVRADYLPEMDVCDKERGVLGCSATSFLPFLYEMQETILENDVLERRLEYGARQMAALRKDMDWFQAQMEKIHSKEIEQLIPAIPHNSVIHEMSLFYREEKHTHASDFVFLRKLYEILRSELIHNMTSISSRGSER